MSSKFKNVSPEIHLLLKTGREDAWIFVKVSILGFRGAKGLTDILVRDKVAPLEKKKSCCRSCEGARCHTYKHFMTAETFRTFII